MSLDTSILAAALARHKSAVVAFQAAQSKIERVRAREALDRATCILAEALADHVEAKAALEERRRQRRRRPAAKPATKTTEAAIKPSPIAAWTKLTEENSGE